MYSKYAGLDMIQAIHLRCGSIISFGSIIRFWVLVKKRNIRFRIKNLALDFSKKKRTLGFENNATRILLTFGLRSDAVSRGKILN